MASAGGSTSLSTSPSTSPCVNICRMHPGTGWCEGCARTIDEIVAWGRMDEAARQRVWTVLPERQAVLRAAIGVARPNPRMGAPKAAT